jgi:arylsulfatase A-like enzyme
MNIKSQPNIILVAVDTLRADHLGCYGYSFDTSPTIDYLAQQGVMVKKLFCSGIPTHPSFTTLYTGQHPITHNIVSHGGKANLNRETPVLPELFLQAGYTTCAVDNLWRSKVWFGRGYEYYLDPSVRRGLLIGVTNEEMNTMALEWLRNRPRKPFFLFIHYWDPHYPLNPPQRYSHMFYHGDPFDPHNHSLKNWWKHPLGLLAKDTWLQRPEGQITDADYIRAMYDQEIRYLDDGISALLEVLKEQHLEENTLLVLVADHGTSLTENNIFFEHHGLYDCTTHVPMIIRWPERLPKAKRMEQMYQMADVGPTLLDAIDLPIPSEMEGRSFYKQIFVNDAPRNGDSFVVSSECTWQAKWSLRTNRYKFILARENGIEGGPERELYDLLADPKEENNLAMKTPSVVDELESELEKWISDRLQANGKTEDPLRTQGISLTHLEKMQNVK